MDEGPCGKFLQAWRYGYRSFRWNSCDINSCLLLENHSSFLSFDVHSECLEASFTSFYSLLRKRCPPKNLTSPLLTMILLGCIWQRFNVRKSSRSCQLMVPRGCLTVKCFPAHMFRFLFSLHCAFSLFYIGGISPRIIIKVYGGSLCKFPTSKSIEQQNQMHRLYPFNH